MGRRRYGFDEAKVQRFFAQGRGQGLGKDYRPWLQIQDVPSLGRSHRPYGIKTDRVHHLLSDGEWHSFMRLESEPDVCDIREQYPLDRIGTMRAAHELGIRHPVTRDGTPYVMTIDFLVTRRSGGTASLDPCTFKYSAQKLTPRQNELIEIARRYYQQRDLELRLLDEHFIDRVLTMHYDVVRAHFDLSSRIFFRTEPLLDIGGWLLDAHESHPDALLIDACRSIACDRNTRPDVVFAVAMHLVARGRLATRLSDPTPLERRPLRDFQPI